MSGGGFLELALTFWIYLAPTQCCETVKTADLTAVVGEYEG